jgi:hypothetical protein
MTDAAAEEGGVFLHRLARILASEVEGELEQRGIIVIRSEIEGRKPTREADHHFLDDKNLYQVTILARWPDHVQSIPAKTFIEQHLRPWAVGLALKLARPGILTTYPLDLPRAVEHAVIGQSDNLVLRVVVDYSMFDDTQVIRIDALASWASP